MKAKFTQKDKHLAFATAVVGGATLGAAYKAHIARSRKTAKTTCEVNGTKLAQKPEMVRLIDKVRLARENAVIKANIQIIPPELMVQALTVDQLDSFHYAVIMGMVEVEEVHPVVTILKDEKGKETSRTVAFHKVRRKANIKEKQTSISELYKRGGHYAPSKLLGAFRGFGGGSSDNDEIENVERFVVFSDGSKMPLQQ